MPKKKILVVDTSVIAKWLNRENEQNLDNSDRIFQEGQKGEIEIIAPELVKYETGNTLINKGVSLLEAKLSLTTIYAIPMKFIPLDQDEALTTMEIAYSGRNTYYDASFLALAKKFGATLVTDNPKHQKSVPGVKVVALKDY